MILAAGRGERMGLLTANLPKPLLSIGNTTLIEHNLMQLKESGITEVIINLHYLCDQIRNHLGDGKKYNLKITYSIEKNLLGTGGGIQNALPYFNHQPFLVLSGDIWTDYPLKDLMNKNVSAAHLVLVNNPLFNLSGYYGLSKNNILNFDSPKLTYASFGILHPDLFCNQKAGAFGLTDALNSAISNQQITGELYHGSWFNIGTAQELKSLNDFLLLPS